MIRRILCWLGFHKYIRLRTARMVDLKMFPKTCIYCGKVKK